MHNKTNGKEIRTIKNTSLRYNQGTGETLVQYRDWENGGLKVSYFARNEIEQAAAFFDTRVQLEDDYIISQIEYALKQSILTQSTTIAKIVGDRLSFENEETQDSLIQRLTSWLSNYIANANSQHFITDLTQTQAALQLILQDIEANYKNNELALLTQLAEIHNNHLPLF